MSVGEVLHLIRVFELGRISFARRGRQNEASCLTDLLCNSPMCRVKERMLTLTLTLDGPHSFLYNFIGIFKKCPLAGTTV